MFLIFNLVGDGGTFVLISLDLCLTVTVNFPTFNKNEKLIKNILKEVFFINFLCLQIRIFHKES